MNDSNWSFHDYLSLLLLLPTNLRNSRNLAFFFSTSSFEPFYSFLDPLAFWTVFPFCFIFLLYADDPTECLDHGLARFGSFYIFAKSTSSLLVCKYVEWKYFWASFAISSVLKPTNPNSLDRPFIVIILASVTMPPFVPKWWAKSYSFKCFGMFLTINLLIKLWHAEIIIIN